MCTCYTNKIKITINYTLKTLAFNALSQLLHKGSSKPVRWEKNLSLKVIIFFFPGVFAFIKKKCLYKSNVIAIQSRIDILRFYNV